MTIDKDKLPYQYSIHRYPFRLQSNENVGFSGLLFEETMYALYHEFRRVERQRLIEQPDGSFVSQAVPAFKLYRRPNCQAVDFTPTENINLGRTLSQSGEYVFSDYIEDMRFELEKIFDGHNRDTDLPSGELKKLYLQNMFGDTPSGAVGDYNHNFNSEVSGCSPVGFNNEFLGTRGTLYDIDFAEVMFQPFIRMSRKVVGSTGAGGFDGRIVSNPIFPAFAHTDGSLITTNSREDSFGGVNPRFIEGEELTAYSDNDTRYFPDYRHVTSGYIEVNGDMFLPGTQYFLDNTEMFPAASGSRDVTLFSTVKSDFSNVFLDNVPAKGSGIYDFSVKNENINLQPISSGISSTSSGVFYYFDKAIWVRRLPDVENFAIYEPFELNRVWHKLRNTDSNFFLANGYDSSQGGAVFLQGFEKNGTTEYIFGGNSSQAHPNHVLFFRYDKQINFVASGTIATGRNDEVLGVTDIFQFGSDFIVPATSLNAAADRGYHRITLPNTYVQVYRFDNISDVESPKGIEINNSSQATPSGFFWGWEPGSSGLIKQFLGGDRARTFEPFKFIKIGDGFDLLPNTGFGVHDIREISNVDGLQNGVWALIKRTGGNNDAWLFRIEEGADFWDVQEMILFPQGRVSNEIFNAERSTDFLDDDF